MEHAPHKCKELLKFLLALYGPNLEPAQIHKAWVISCKCPPPQNMTCNQIHSETCPMTTHKTSLAQRQSVQWMLCTMCTYQATGFEKRAEQKILSLWHQIVAHITLQDGIWKSRLGSKDIKCSRWFSMGHVNSHAHVTVFDISWEVSNHF